MQHHNQNNDAIDAGETPIEKRGFWSILWERIRIGNNVRMSMVGSVRVVDEDKYLNSPEVRALIKEMREMDTTEINKRTNEGHTPGNKSS